MEPFLRRVDVFGKVSTVSQLFDLFEHASAFAVVIPEMKNSIFTPFLSAISIEFVDGNSWYYANQEPIQSRKPLTTAGRDLCDLLNPSDLASNEIRSPEMSSASTSSGVSLDLTIKNGYLTVLWMISSGVCHTGDMMMNDCVLTFYEISNEFRLIASIPWNSMFYGIPVNVDESVDIAMNLVKNQKHPDLELFLIKDLIN
jgi:hypothetical protein